MLDHDELIDYALGRLDESRRVAVEHQIARDPAMAQRVALLVRNLRRLLNDGRGGLPWETPAYRSLPTGAPAAIRLPPGQDGEEPGRGLP